MNYSRMEGNIEMQLIARNAQVEEIGEEKKKSEDLFSLKSVLSYMTSYSFMPLE